MTDNGARALSVRLQGIRPDMNIPQSERYAAAILANGAVFLPDAAELDRLRETNEGLYLAVQMTAKEQDRLRQGLQWALRDNERLRRIEAAARDLTEKEPRGTLNRYRWNALIAKLRAAEEGSARHGG